MLPRRCSIAGIYATVEQQSMRMHAESQAGSLVFISEGLALGEVQNGFIVCHEVGGAACHLLLHA